MNWLKIRSDIIVVTIFWSETPWEDGTCFSDCHYLAQPVHEPIMTLMNNLFVLWCSTHPSG